MLLKFIKFGIVGFFGLCVDFGITYLLKEKLLWNKFLSNAAGFTVAVISNYFLNRIWTFQSSDPDIGGQLLSFFLISMLGLLLNTAVLYFLHQVKHYNFYLGKAGAVMIVFCWNFSANSFITFS